MGGMNIGILEAAKVLGCSRQRVQQLCMAGRVEGAEKVSGVWVIPLPVTVAEIDRFELPPGTVNTYGAAGLLGISHQRVSILCQTARIVGAAKDDTGVWVIPTPVTVLPAENPPGRPLARV